MRFSWTEASIIDSLNRYEIPEDMHSGVVLYLLFGIEPGGFLFALFSNDLGESFARADMNNTMAMHKWAKWLYNAAPSTSHGSPERVREWMAERRAAVEVKK